MNLSAQRVLVVAQRTQVYHWLYPQVWQARPLVASRFRCWLAGQRARHFQQV
jgi:hypothetical protein